MNKLSPVDKWSQDRLKHMNLYNQETDPEKRKQYGEYIFMCEIVLKRFARLAQEEEEERVRLEKARVRLEARMAQKEEEKRARIEKARARLEARMARKEEEERVRIEEAKAHSEQRVALEQAEGPQARCTIC